MPCHPGVVDFCKAFSKAVSDAVDGLGLERRTGGGGGGILASLLQLPDAVHAGAGRRRDVKLTSTSKFFCRRQFQHRTEWVGMTWCKPFFDVDP